jgi:DNA-directed RNA polymerase subunit F
MIEEVFQSAKGGAILFLGRLKNFTEDEVKIFLKQYEATFTTELDSSVVAVIESTMLTPPQEEVSYAVYKQKIPTFRLDEFERLYAEKITPDSLLMSLKLSNDQARLIRLLKNEAFEKSLYLKLFKLYDWRGEGVHESDENRDVTNTFVKRFYNPEQFMDPAMIYSPVTLMTIAAESEDSEVLDAMLTMPHYEIKVSKSEKRPRTLKEMIAINPHSSKETLIQLSRFKNRDIDYFLVHNDTLPHTLQEQIYKRADYEIKKMLTQNANLSDRLFDTLLEEDEEIVSYLFSFARIDKKRLEKIRNHRYFSILGNGEGIEEVVEELLAIEDEALQYKLAENPLLKAEALERIYARYTKRVAKALSANPNTPKHLLEEFSNLPECEEVLSANPNTPKDILIAYFERDDEKLNRALASNESMPIAYLQQFQLDPSLMHILSNNKTFTKNILNGLGI